MNEPRNVGVDLCLSYEFEARVLCQHDDMTLVHVAILAFRVLQNIFVTTVIHDTDNTPRLE
jgi:hypothetical protein